MITFSSRKLEIFPPSGKPPLENWISMYLPCGVGGVGWKDNIMYTNYSNGRTAQSTSVLILGAAVLNFPNTVLLECFASISEF